jgi:phosphatidylglycerophosphate synthase
MSTKVTMSPQGSSALGDRRPIASRNLRVWQVTAGWLARAGVSPHVISALGMLAAFVGAGALGVSEYVPSPWSRALLLIAAVCILLRLLANMLDGMVAIAAGKASPLGELFNEVPDRLSDTAILMAAGYAAGDPLLGWQAAAMALFVSYIRALGKGMGVPGLFQGPMAKSHRMIAVIVACVYLGVAPKAWQPEFSLPWGIPPGNRMGLMAAILVLIIFGGTVTVLRRLSRLMRAIKERR